MGFGAFEEELEVFEVCGGVWKGLESVDEGFARERRIGMLHRGRDRTAKG